MNGQAPPSVIETGIMEHLGISNRHFLAILNIKKSHTEVAYSKGVSCEGTIAITQGISSGKLKSA